MSNIEMPFSSLQQQVERLTSAVDKCFVPSIYVHTYKIASLVKSIDSMNLTESQKRVYDKLDAAVLKQFERLSNGRCACSVAKDI